MRTTILALTALLGVPAAPALAQAGPGTTGSPVLVTPLGAAVLGSSAGGVSSAILPQGGTGLVTHNGNGTSTITEPNGRVSTVPSRR